MIELKLELDKEKTIQDLKNRMDIFVEERKWKTYHSPKELAIAISIEANELLELFLFKNPTLQEMKADGMLHDKLKDEIADILAYLLSIVNSLEIDLTTAFLEKMKKNNKKYPRDKFKNGYYKKQ